MWKFIALLLLFSLSSAVHSAPARVTSLQTVSANASSVTVSWTTPAPGSGILLENDVRYSTVAITALNWATRPQAVGEPVPVQAGQTQSAIVSGLQPNTKYYLALKVRDGTGWSLVSNVVSTTLTAGKTVQVTWTPYYPANGLLGFRVCQSKVETGPYVCTDVGNVTSYTYTNLVWGSRDYFTVSAYHDGYVGGYTDTCRTWDDPNIKESCPTNPVYVD